MANPQRVQLRRTKGWRKPPAAVLVARPSRWGNPFRIGSNQPTLFVHDGFHVLWTTPRSGNSLREARVEAVRRFGEAVQQGRGNVPWPAEIRGALAGHDLACWCPLDQACHADVLLELANRPGGVA